MGMFTNDILFGGERLDKHVVIGTKETGVAGAEKVLLLDATIASEEIPTSLGNATKSILKIIKLSDDGTTTVGEPMDLGTLSSAIADKVRLKEDGDLPAVVAFFVVQSGTEGYNDATVMQLVSRWDGKVPKFQPLEETIPF